MKNEIKQYFSSLFLLWGIKLTPDTEEGRNKTISMIANNEELLKENQQLKKELEELKQKRATGIHIKPGVFNENTIYASNHYYTDEKGSIRPKPMINELPNQPGE